MSTKVAEKVVLITGANRGIGLAIVEEAFQRGAAKVYAAVRDPKSAQPLVDQFGEKVVPIEVDLIDHDSIRAAAALATDVDIVVNNAGVLKTASPLAEHAIDALQYELKVNVFGLLAVAQAFAPVLAQNGGGTFVQLNSVASVKNFADFATYSASKAAAYSLTQGLRDKLALQNTHVVSVHPGPIKTQMAADAGFDQADPPSVVAEGLFDAIEDGSFHVWPDTIAKQFGDAYASFATNIVEANFAEA